MSFPFFRIFYAFSRIFIFRPTFPRQNAHKQAERILRPSFFYGLPFCYAEKRKQRAL